MHIMLKYDLSAYLSSLFFSNTDTEINFLWFLISIYKTQKSINNYFKFYNKNVQCTMPKAFAQFSAIKQDQI